MRTERDEWGQWSTRVREGRKGGGGHDVVSRLYAP